MLAQILETPAAVHTATPTVQPEPDAAATPRLPHPSWAALPWRWVSADWLNALSADWVAALSLSALAQLSRLTCGGLAPDFVRALSPAQLAALFHVEALSPAAVAALTPDQVRALPSIWRWVDAEWINALDDPALAALTPAQLGDLGVYTLAALSPRVLRHFDEAQRAALPADLLVDLPAGAAAPSGDAGLLTSPAASAEAPVRGVVTDPLPVRPAPASVASIESPPALSDGSVVRLEPPCLTCEASDAEEDWAALGLDVLDASPPASAEPPSTAAPLAPDIVADEPFVGQRIAAVLAAWCAPPRSDVHATAGPPDPSPGVSEDPPWPVILDPRLRPHGPHVGRGSRTSLTDAFRADAPVDAAVHRGVSPADGLRRPPRSMAARWRAMAAPRRAGARIARAGLAAAALCAGPPVGGRGRVDRLAAGDLARLAAGPPTPEGGPAAVGHPGFFCAGDGPRAGRAWVQARGAPGRAGWSGSQPRGGTERAPPGAGSPPGLRGVAGPFDGLLALAARGGPGP